MPKIKTLEYFRVPPRWLFVKITDETGQYGWGEATLEGHSEAVEGCLDAFAKKFIGYEANDIEHIWQTGYRGGFYRGGPVLMSALSGLDIALWDLKARTLNTPIHHLLGGQVRKKVRVYAWIGGDRPASVSAAARTRRAQGFRAVKMNATEDVGWLDSPSVLAGAVERVRTVRGLGMDVAVDFHGRLHRPMAKRLVKMLEDEGVLFVEEPLLSENPEGIKQISELSSVPIALGERTYGRWDVKRFLKDNSIDILQPDVSHCGGLSELHRLASLCETFDIALAPHCPLGPIALAACFQIALCTPNHVIQEMGFGIHYNTEAGEADVLSYIKADEGWGPFSVVDGYVDAAGWGGVGLGIEVDEEAVRKAAGGEAWRSGWFLGADGGMREW
ncbi:mandelate racemase/muconate lactonizing enzyme family protein [Patellaria atrata CBS 101060]|uniref:Mandelate racemase/muconate lactonizing enzyme family protein n=1 Tax=Patellaria atrata CBS 101060 TaxID=1346257 RepID=A0A9P4VQM3_9PEZI|nr:mandelate racemase/muconate lactonizing enzyme family protein [Patellaria atrata CBS 101060]